MIHKSLACLLGAMLGLLAALPAGAAEAVPAPAAATDRPAVVQNCPAPGAMLVAEPTQSDCCKGHKGVCGCRAGKIVCCDGTSSPNCACHGDEGLLN